MSTIKTAEQLLAHLKKARRGRKASDPSVAAKKFAEKVHEAFDTSQGYLGHETTLAALKLSNALRRVDEELHGEARTFLDNLRDDLTSLKKKYDREWGGLYARVQAL
jgi:hypothetical protein